MTYQLPDERNYRWLEKPPRNEMAVASVVLGAIGLPLFFLFGVPSLLAVVFGHIARGQIKARSERGMELAIIGMVTGYLVVAFWVAIGLYWLVVAATRVA